MSKKSRNQSNRKAGFSYYVREGLSSVFVHGFTSLAAMLVIAACLMITGIFSLVAYNIDLQVRENIQNSLTNMKVEFFGRSGEALGLESLTVKKSNRRRYPVPAGAEKAVFTVLRCRGNENPEIENFSPRAVQF